MIALLLAMQLISQSQPSPMQLRNPTTVADTVYHADGTTATGTVIINWPTFTTMTGEVIQGGSQSTTIAAGGVLSVALVPNVGATPIGTYYTAVYHLDDGSLQKEYWVIPVSTASVRIGVVKNSVLPTSVAMQTVSKSYVDTAIAAAVTAHPLDSSPVIQRKCFSVGECLMPTERDQLNPLTKVHQPEPTEGMELFSVALVPTVPQLLVTGTSFGSPLMKCRTYGEYGHLTVHDCKMREGATLDAVVQAMYEAIQQSNLVGWEAYKDLRDRVNRYLAVTGNIYPQPKVKRKKETR